MKRILILLVLCFLCGCSSNSAPRNLKDMIYLNTCPETNMSYGRIYIMNKDGVIEVYTIAVQKEIDAFVMNNNDKRMCAQISHKITSMFEGKYKKGDELK